MFDQPNISIKISGTIRDAISRISQNSLQIICVTDENNKYLGTVTDGDIRRGLLKGLTLESKIDLVVNQKSFYLKDSDLAKFKPGSVPTGISIVPLLNENYELIRLMKLNDIVQSSLTTIPVVIMAGGKGERLKPLTNKTPKPMLKIGDKPILEHLIFKLQEFGFEDIHITVNYLADQIIEHFRDGSDFGVRISFHREASPRGTAGSLSQIVGYENTPILIMNSDLITSINLKSLINFHKNNAYDMTICTRNYEIQIPFGVITTSGDLVKGVDEKPVISFPVNAGVYVINSELIDLLPPTEYMDMTDFINEISSQEITIGNFPIFESWLDVGQHSDLAQARTLSFSQQKS